jgi:hypothetical protein
MSATNFVPMVEVIRIEDEEDYKAVHAFFAEGDRLNGVSTYPTFVARCACGWPRQPRRGAVLFHARNEREAAKEALQRHIAAFQHCECRIVVMRSPLH